MPELGPARSTPPAHPAPGQARPGQGAALPSRPLPAGSRGSACGRRRPNGFRAPVERARELRARSSRLSGGAGGEARGGGGGRRAPRACRSRSRGRRDRGRRSREAEAAQAAAWRRRWAAWASCKAESGWQPRPPRPPPSAGPAAGRRCREPPPPPLSSRPGGATVPRRRKRRSCGSGTWMTSTKVTSGRRQSLGRLSAAAPAPAAPGPPARGGPWSPPRHCAGEGRRWGGCPAARGGKGRERSGGSSSSSSSSAPRPVALWQGAGSCRHGNCRGGAALVSLGLVFFRVPQGTCCVCQVSLSEVASVGHFNGRK